MSKIDFKQVYKDRIKQIDKDIIAAVRDKKWTELAKLEAEKAKLQEYIKE